MRKIALIGYVSALLWGCDSSVKYSDFVSVGKAWNKDRVVEFDLEVKDTLNAKDIYIMIRNNEQYPYSNLFLIAQMQMPDRTVISDTLEYEMANPDGSWKGYGVLGTKESKLWYKEKVVFPKSGIYHFRISQAMRNITEIEGVGNLVGITDVGIQIENHQDKKEEYQKNNE